MSNSQTFLCNVLYLRLMKGKRALSLLYSPIVLQSNMKSSLLLQIASAIFGKKFHQLKDFLAFIKVDVTTRVIISKT